MITPAQSRAARGLLDWSQQRLADAAQVGVVTIHQFEGGITEPRKATLAAIIRAFEAAGVAFTNGDEPGVKLRKRARKKA
jgi:predicted transcriptional regulator